MAAPLIFLLYGSSLNTESALGVGAVTFQHFGELARSPQFWTDFGHTVLLGAATGVGAGVVGVLIAWIIVHVQPPGKSVFDALMVVPFFLSSFLVALAWSDLANPGNGLISLLISDAVGHHVVAVNIYSFAGLVFVLVTGTVPFVYMLTAASLSSSDVSLDEAAAMCGARKFHRLRTITFPMVAPSILAGVFFAIVFALESFAEPTIIGAPFRFQTLTTDIFNDLTNFPTKYSTASAIAVILMALTIVLVYFQGRFQGARSFVAFTGKSGSAASISSGYSRTTRILLMLVPLVYVIIAVGLPYAALLLISLQPFATPNITVLNFNNYVSVFTNSDFQTSLWHSILAGAVGTAFSLVWMFILCYVIQRVRFPGRKLASYLATLPLAVPGVVLGVALLWMWLRSPVHVYGTIWLISIGYIVKYSPFVYRTVMATIDQLDPGLEESARMSGASRARGIIDVVIPLARPSLLAGAIIFAIFAMRDINTSILLAGPTSSSILSVVIWNDWESGTTPQVAAAAIVQSLILVVLYILARVISRRLPRAGQR
jgi:iron(III) transport system permease protein